MHGTKADRTGKPPMDENGQKPSETTPMIKAYNASFFYDNEQILALDKLNVHLEQGGFIAIIGPNASGKSTFAQLCNALLLATSGDFWVLGQACTADREDYPQSRQSVGLVFQNPENQALIGIVEEDIAFGLCNLGLPPDEIELRVNEALQAVGMQDYRKHSTQRLSCGQKQKIALAGVLAMRPSCIVLDEATTMLDPVSRQELLKILSFQRAQQHITVILITHNMSEAMQADHLIVLDKGRVVLQGSPQEVFSKSETLLELGLDLPPLIKLCLELAQAGCPISTQVPTADDCEEMLFKMLTKESTG